MNEYMVKRNEFRSIKLNRRCVCASHFTFSLSIKIWNYETERNENCSKFQASLNGKLNNLCEIKNKESERLRANLPVLFENLCMFVSECFLQFTGVKCVCTVH